MATRGTKRKARQVKTANRKPKTKSLKRKPSVSGVRKVLDAAKRLISKGLKAISRAASRVSPSAKVTVIRGPKQVTSSWVDQIAFVRKGRRNGVAVKFLSGYEAFYPNTTIKDYEYLRDAASKGKAIWRRFYELPYEELN